MIRYRGYVLWPIYSPDESGWYVDITNTNGTTLDSTDICGTERAAIDNAKAALFIKAIVSTMD